MAGAGRRDRATVVVVDDDPDVRTLLRLFLRAEGFDVVGEAVDGEQAIEVVSLLRPDVVVLDLQMPVLDGFDALPYLRLRSPASAVIVYSAHATGVDVDTARELGADRLVPKTAGLDALRQAVTAAADVSAVS